jgi:hypothetical protein
MTGGTVAAIGARTSVCGLALAGVDVLGGRSRARSAS